MKCARSCFLNFQIPLCLVLMRSLMLGRFMVTLPLNLLCFDLFPIFCNIVTLFCQYLFLLRNSPPFDPQTIFPSFLLSLLSCNLSFFFVVVGRPMLFPDPCGYYANQRLLPCGFLTLVAATRPGSFALMVVARPRRVLDSYGWCAT